MSEELRITQVSISDLKPATYNPRKWSEDKTQQLTESIRQFGLVDPILVNGANERKNIVIGGHFRSKSPKTLGMLKYLWFTSIFRMRLKKKSLT